MSYKRNFECALVVFEAV
uniref:Uncharacterized protein n=1 Tax=Arundo donax TaxID=35708 RepID=A0A0A9ALH6_ARUDO